jgi:uncharacterized membrane protein HdeD (DUF308 family)
MEDVTWKQVRPFWLMLSLATIIIIFWIITIYSPSIFWKFMDIILWFFLLTSGISAMINAFKNKNSSLVWVLWIGWFLLALIWFWLIFSWSQLVWTIMIWIFALWALIRWVTLIIFWLNNKETQSLRRGIVWLWWLLFILAIVIAISDKSEARTLAWICIWISTVIDWISLLVAALKLKNINSLQSQIVDKANQNEISQWDIIVTETVVISQDQDNQTNN